MNFPIFYDESIIEKTCVNQIVKPPKNDQKRPKTKSNCEKVRKYSLAAQRYFQVLPSVGLTITTDNIQKKVVRHFETLISVNIFHKRSFFKFLCWSFF